MKTWILSSDSQIPSTKRLLQALKKSKIETEVLNPLELQFEFGRHGSRLFHQGRNLKLPDLVLPRLGWNSLDYGLKLVRFLESTGVQVCNSADSLEKASDKLLSLQLFHREGLPIPQTRKAHLTTDSEWHLLRKHDSHVFKTHQGSQGFGVVWQTNRRQSQAQIDTLRTAQVPVLTQELIAESFGQDVRAFVIDGKVVAAMKRQGPPEDLRSNLHQDGKGSKIKLSLEETELAKKAAQALGLFYAGVDFLQTKKGPLLLEANPFPGFEGINEISGKNLAAFLVQSILR
jgi:ribosomal protein S6--L-glutamate ligase